MHPLPSIHQSTIKQYIHYRQYRKTAFTQNNLRHIPPQNNNYLP